MEPTDVIVVGAGPTGLMLANELALAGVSVRVLERRAEQPNITRAFAVHARTLEILDARGLADDLLPRGVPVPEIQPAPGARLDLRELPTRYPMILIAPQSGTERVLEARATELGVEVERGAEVVAVRQNEDEVALELADGRTAVAKYVVGCDGAHSAIRRLVGIEFAGAQYETHIMLADVRLANPPEEAMFAKASNAGVVIVVPFGDGWFRAIAWDRLREQVPLDVPLPMEEMRDAFKRIAGDDFGMLEQRWSSRFLSERRQASRYRAGRVFIAGDAAHVHSPLGGQGMNTGIQDAMNLGWKLAATVQGWAAPGLLDSYEAERHRVGAQVLKLTDGFNKLILGRNPLRRLLQTQVIRALVRFDATRTRLAGRFTGLGIAYPATERHAHPLAGHRMPDVECDGGRLYELMRDGRFLLVSAEPLAVESEHVRVVRRTGPADLPAVVLVRPDGYVAWASDDAGQAPSAVARWCSGPARVAA